jgi:hypothetical protein
MSPAFPHFFFQCPAILVQHNKKGIKKATKMDELKVKVAQIESGRPALETLFRQVLALDSKLSEDKK